MICVNYCTPQSFLLNHWSNQQGKVANGKFIIFISLAPDSTGDSYIIYYSTRGIIGLSSPVHATLSAGIYNSRMINIVTSEVFSKNQTCSPLLCNYIITVHNLVFERRVKRKIFISVLHATSDKCSAYKVSAFDCKNIGLFHSLRAISMTPWN